MKNETTSFPLDGILRNLLDEIRSTLNEISSDDVEGLVREVISARCVFVAGAGRSGLAMRGFAMRLMHLGLHVHVVGETTTPAIGAGDLLLIGSGSGATDRLVQYAGQGIRAGARLAVVTADPESPAARPAHLVIYVPAPTPKSSRTTGRWEEGSSQPMGTLFEQSLALMLDGIVMLLMARLGETGDSMFTRHADLE